MNTDSMNFIRETKVYSLYIDSSLRFWQKCKCKRCRNAKKPYIGRAKTDDDFIFWGLKCHLVKMRK